MKSSLVAAVRKFKQVLAKAGTRHFLASLSQRALAGIVRVAAFVRRELGQIVRSPAKSLGRLGAPILIVGSAYIFLYNVFSNDVFVDDAEIQGAAKERGFTGEILTQAAIAAMPSVAGSRLDELPDFHAGFLQLIDRRSDRFDSERVCNNQFPLVQSDYGLFLAALPRPEMSSQTPDQVVSSQSLSIKKLAYWTRERLGFRTARQLKPVLYSDGDRFVLKVVPVPPHIGERKQTFDKLDDAPRILARLLLDFLLPELLATELAGTGLTSAGNFVFPLTVAEHFLMDRQKVLFVSNVLISTQLERSRTFASRRPLYVQWEAANRQILAETDYKRYGDLAIFLKVGVAERIFAAELFRGMKVGAPQTNPAALHKKHLGKYEDELAKTPAGRIGLTLLDIRRGDMKAFALRLDGLLKERVVRADGEIVSPIDIASFAAAVLIEEGHYGEAGKILLSPRWTADGIDRSKADSAMLFRALRSVVRVSQGDPSEFSALVDGRLGAFPCIQYMASSHVYDAWRFGRVDKAAHPDLLRALRVSFGQLEKSGLRNFAFYNTWGTLETEAGDPEAAFGTFEKAMRYEGDHEWALLNWGNAAIQAGKTDLAREKYAKSLKLGTIPKAVAGLLNALLGQEDATAYLDAFEKYALALGVFDHPVRSDLERIAIIFSCRIDRPLKTSVLRQGERIVLQGETMAPDDLRREACAPGNKPR